MRIEDVRISSSQSPTYATIELKFTSILVTLPISATSFGRNM